MGEGDCDHDDDCAGNLLCGDNNCVGLTFDGSDDCCYVSNNFLIRSFFFTLCLRRVPSARGQMTAVMDSVGKVKVTVTGIVTAMAPWCVGRTTV